jgi:spermidine/putrescine transport system ATP-binding protein
MSVGRLEQIGPPDEIYNHPCSPFVASFVGENNAIQGKVAEIQGDYAALATSLGLIRCRNPRGLGRGREATAFIRPETIFPARSGNGGENVFECTAVSQSFEGAYSNVRLATEGGHQFVMRLSNDGSEPPLDKSRPINISFKPENAVVLAEDEPGRD